MTTKKEIRKGILTERTQTGNYKHTYFSPSGHLWYRDADGELWEGEYLHISANKKEMIDYIYSTIN